MIDKFLEYLLLEKNYSPLTVKSYKNDLQSLSLFLQKHKTNSCIEQSNFKDIRNYISYLSENNNLESTINRKISTLKSFFHFLCKIKAIEKSPLIGIKSLKSSKKLHTVISERELERLLNNEQLFSDNFINQRNKTLIEILYSTGIRKSELMNLSLESIDFYQSLIKVIGKRNKERMIPISPILIQQIKKYLLFRETVLSESNTLFVNLKGKKIAEKTIYNIVNSHLKLVSVKQKTGPHILRHSFATHLLNNGGDISSIKDLLGHSSLSSTQVYTSISINNLKKVFNQSHPRGLVKSKSYDN